MKEAVMGGANVSENTSTPPDVSLLDINVRAFDSYKYL